MLGPGWAHGSFRLVIANIATSDPQPTSPQALISQNVSVVVLARPDSTSISNPLLQGAKVVTVDFADTQAMSDIFRENNVEVLVSAISLPGIEAQKPLADAAKEAGVKLFVPSEFGMATEGCKEGFLSEKEHFAGWFFVSAADHDPHRLGLMKCHTRLY